MGQFLALSITDLLTKIGMTGIPLIVGLMFLGGLLTLFISSGSAIWSIFAPIFVPIMMYIGYQLKEMSL